MPTFNSAAIDATGTVLAVNLDTSDPPHLPGPDPQGFTLRVGGFVRGTENWTRTGATTYQESITSVVYPGQGATLDYTPGNVTDSSAARDPMGPFGSEPVTNGVSPSFVVIPVARSLKTP